MEMLWVQGGSVIPLFVDQILSNKPITVTDLEMTRFMMSMGVSFRACFICVKVCKKW